MKVTQGSLKGKKAYVIRDVFKGDVLQVAGKTYTLSKDVEEMHVLQKEESKSAVSMILILLLGVTIIGLIIAIPMLIAHKKVLAVVGIKFKDGVAFVGTADKGEWQTLSKYQPVALPEGFNVT